MKQQFVHNVQPGTRQFVTQSTGQPARVAASNGGRPPTIDSRHLAAPGVPARATNALAGPEFERAARGFVALVELYATNIAASGTAGPGVTVDDLKQLPLARLQQLALALPTKPVQANRGGTADPYATYPDNPGADEFEGYDPNDPMGTGSGGKS